MRQQLRWIYDSIAAAPVAGARGDVFPLPTALSAEDEVLVTAAEKGDNKALKSKASREAGHRVWLHCITLVLNALPFSPQSFAKGKSGAAFAGISRPSERIPSGKMEALRRLEDQVHKSRSSETMVPFLTQAAVRLCSWNQTPSFSGTRRTCMLASSCLNYHLRGESTLCPRGPFGGKVFDRDPPQRIYACLGLCRWAGYRPLELCSTCTDDLLSFRLRCREAWKGDEIDRQLQRGRANSVEK